MLFRGKSEKIIFATDMTFSETIFEKMLFRFVLTNLFRVHFILLLKIKEGSKEKNHVKFPLQLVAF